MKDERKFKPTIGLTVGVILVLTALALSVKMLSVIFYVNSLGGSFLSPEVMVYAFGLWIIMFSAGMIIGPSWRNWQHDRKLQKTRAKA